VCDENLTMALLIVSVSPFMWDSPTSVRVIIGGLSVHANCCLLHHCRMFLSAVVCWPQCHVMRKLLRFSEHKHCCLSWVVTWFRLAKATFSKVYFKTHVFELLGSILSIFLPGLIRTEILYKFRSCCCVDVPQVRKLANRLSVLFLTTSW